MYVNTFPCFVAAMATLDGLPPSNILLAIVCSVGFGVALELVSGWRYYQVYDVFRLFSYLECLVSSFTDNGQRRIVNNSQFITGAFGCDVLPGLAYRFPTDPGFVTIIILSLPFWLGFCCCCRCCYSCCH